MTTFAQFAITGILIGGVYALIAIGFVVIYKASGVFNFAQGELVAIGGFVCWSFLAQMGLPPWISLLGTFGMAAFLGFALERTFLHRLVGQPLLSLVMMTLAISVILRGIVALFWGGPAVAFPQGFMPTGSVHLGDIVLSQQYIWTFVLSLAMVGIFFIFFSFTKTGLAMRATSEGHQLAHSVGIRVRNIFMLSWIIACMISAAGGILLGVVTGLHVGLTAIGLKAIPVVLLGGLESIPGALIGGLIIGFVEGIVGGYIDPLIGGGGRDVIPYLIMIVVLLFRPQGLFGWKRIERV